MQTSNPVFRNDPKGPGDRRRDDCRWLVWKTFFLLMLAVVTASATWVIYASGQNLAIPAAVGAAFLGFILAMVISFKPTWAAVLAPVYALVEGVFLGESRPS